MDYSKILNDGFDYKLAYKQISIKTRNTHNTHSKIYLDRDIKWTILNMIKDTINRHKNPNPLPELSDKYYYEYVSSGEIGRASCRERV